LSCCAALCTRDVSPQTLCDYRRPRSLPTRRSSELTSLETAVRLVKEGAEDYFGKPWDDDKLINSVRKLLGVRSLRMENRRLKARDRKSTRLNSSNVKTSYAVFCLNKKNEGNAVMRF